MISIGTGLGLDVAAVMDALARALGSLDGLTGRTYAYPAPSVVPPAAFVGWPDEIDYDAVMGRGGWSLTVPVLVVVGRADLRSARDAIAVYLAGSGPSSIRGALEGSTAAYDAARVTRAHVEPVSIAGIEYLAALVDVEIVGGV